MSEEKPKTPATTPTEVARVDVKRVTPDHLVLQDAFLKGCELVKAMGEEAAAALMRRGTARRYSPTARIYTADDDSGALYLVLKGEVRLLRKGTQAELRVARRGEIFGEGGTRTCSAVADGDVDVLELPARAVEEAGQAAPKLREYLTALEKKHASATAEMDDFLNRW
ncbi:MAG: Crp/Fnr family transcriptional regulator [Myxococcaceae bacterium]